MPAEACATEGTEAGHATMRGGCGGSSGGRMRVRVGSGVDAM